MAVSASKFVSELLSQRLDLGINFHCKESKKRRVESKREGIGFEADSRSREGSIKRSTN